MSLNEMIQKMNSGVKDSLESLWDLSDATLYQNLTNQEQGYLAQINEAAWNIRVYLDNLSVYSSLLEKGIEVHKSWFDSLDFLKEIRQKILGLSGFSPFSIEFHFDPQLPSRIRGDVQILSVALATMFTWVVHYSGINSIILNISIEKNGNQSGILTLGIQTKDSLELVSMRPDENEFLYSISRQLSDALNGELIQLFQDADNVNWVYALRIPLEMDLNQPLCSLNLQEKLTGFQFFSMVSNPIQRDALLHELDCLCLYCRPILLDHLDDLAERNNIVLFLEKKFFDEMLEQRMVKMGIHPVILCKSIQEYIPNMDCILNPVDAISLYQILKELKFQPFISNRSEKIIEIKSNTNTETKFQQPVKVEIPFVEGIDEAAGVDASGSELIYLQVVKEFWQSGELKWNLIQKYFQEDEIRSFIVEVHALKSTARLIGATVLSEKALLLEQKIETMENEVAREKVEELVLMYQTLLTRLEEAYHFNEANENAKEIPVQNFQLAIQSLRKLVADFDFENADYIIEKLDTYRVPKQYSNSYRKLKTLMTEVARDDIILLIDNEILA